MPQKKVKVTMINHMMTDRYGPEWSSFYNTEDFLDYLYKTDDQVLVGSEHLDWGYMYTVHQIPL